MHRKIRRIFLFAMTILPMMSFATQNDDGYMEGVNPKLEWYEHTEKNGCPGLARGKDSPCIFKLRLKE